MAEREKRSWRDRILEMNETTKYLIVFGVIAVYIVLLLLKYFS